MATKLIGIVGNTLYIEPFYGGDHIHEATINDITKSDLIDRGVKEYSHVHYIEMEVFGQSQWKLQG